MSDFAFKIDENMGVYDLPRKTKTGPQEGLFPTNNLTATLIYQPEFTAKNSAKLSEDLSLKYGAMFQAGAWLRTADFHPDFSKSILRFLAGPVLFAQLPFEHVSFKLVDAPTIFFGLDANGDLKRNWSSIEFGNYAALSATLPDLLDLTADFHTWYVHGLGVTAGADMPMVEDGYILGNTLSFKPFKNMDCGVLKGLEAYFRYRFWNWDVHPEGTDGGKTGWNEGTAGVTMPIPI